MNNLHAFLSMIVRIVQQAGARLRITGRLALSQAARGQGLVEYALILVLIAIVVIGVVTQLGGKTSQIFSSVSCTLDGGAVATSNHPGNPLGGGGGLGNNTTTTGGC
jgi:pilus assembly protein Flp/PilA